MDFSIIIPAYNAQAFLRDALLSLERQRLPAAEVLVIDDGSTDRTAGIAEAWFRTSGHPGRLLRQENQGLPATRNRGIEEAASPHVALLDADDIYLPEHLSRIADCFAKQPDAIAAFTDTALFGDGVEPSDRTSTRAKAIAASDRLISPDLYLLGGQTYRSVLAGNYIAPSALAFNKSAALAAGLFDAAQRYIEDRDFLMRLCRRGPFVFVDTVTVKCRVHCNNITHPRNQTRNLQFASRVLEKAIRASSEYGLTELELALTRRQLATTVDAWLYSASLSGLGAYTRAQRSLLGSATVGPRVNPVHLLRATAASVGIVRNGS